MFEIIVTPVNDAPEVINSMPDLEFSEGIDEFSISLSNYFSDVDNEELIFNYPTNSYDLDLFNIELSNSDDLILYSISNIYSLIPMFFNSLQ